MKEKKNVTRKLTLNLKKLDKKLVIRVFFLNGFFFPFKNFYNNTKKHLKATIRIIIT